MKIGISFDPKTGTFSNVRPSGTTLFRGWPDISALQTTPSGETVVASLPRFRLPAGDLEFRIKALESPGTRRGQILIPFMISPGERFRNRAKIAWFRWCRLIPTDVRGLVARFPGRHWELLVFLARCGRPAIDLAKANPALAFALAHGGRFRDVRTGEIPEAAGALLGPGRKQKEILGWLGFPETEAARRLMTKVVPAATSVAFLLRLRRALHDPESADAMARLPRLNVGALRILTDPELRERAGHRLLLEVSRAPAEDRRAVTGILLRRSLELARRLLPASRQDLSPGSIVDVKETYKGLAAFGERFGGDRLAIRFSRPPVPGTKTIVPITTARELLEESWTQRHCAASYVEQVAEEQDIYFYRVLAPERCTLMIALERGDWVAKEVRRACNGNPSGETIAAVRDWMVRLTGLPANWTLARELRYLAF
ncbi:MAG TPA: hypothetical protein VFS09_00925 [Candidatus Eisenbacteria bacterium]|nr:hypothetical protein [Candidatus Eisenbacteria bacterium]